MHRFTLNLIGSIALLMTLNLPVRAYAGGDDGLPRNPDHLDAAVIAAKDSPAAEEAIQTLRDAGQIGMDVFMAINWKKLSPIINGEISENDPNAARVIRAAERIARQKDAHLSGLFWHTDLAKAQAASEVSGKPVLVLRLLGNLDESMSCANSRLFRVVLYPDPSVRNTMSRMYELCWLPVRSAPVMTVDLGDGRSIQRTITGNSLHTVLDPNGGVVDVMPGLISPQTFADWLLVTHELVTTPKPLPVVESVGDAFVAMRVDPAEAAQVAMQRTFAKTLIELPAFDAGLLAPGFGQMLVKHNPQTQENGSGISGAAAMIQEKIQIHHGMRRAITRETTTPEQESVLRHRLIRSITADTGINLLQLQPAIRRWLNDQPNRPGLEETTSWVYANVFATPLDDPWMGLALFETFTGLPKGGRFENTSNDPFAAQ